LTKAQLYEQLNAVDHSRNTRQFYADIIVNDHSLIAPLLDIVFDVDDHISCKAAWVLDYFCNQNLELLIPHLTTFTENISKVYRAAAVRPIARICEALIKKSYSKKESNINKWLTKSHEEKIIEACFDWMITDQKVAPKAYAMQTLYILGYSYHWIHPELNIIIERDFSLHSAAFKARARHILKKINR
jgi:hypothetical protein